MYDFLVPLSEEQLDSQVFNLMYTSMGSGLGMSYAEVMNLEVTKKDSLLRLLFDRVEQEAEAMKKGG